MHPLLSRRALLGVLGAAAALGPGLAGAQTFPADRIPRISYSLWRWMNAQLVLEPGLLWLDTAAFGPTLRAVLGRAYRNLEAQSLDFRGFESEFGPGSPVERAVLADAARFFGADPGELVFTDGARAGLGLVAAGLELEPGDEVLTSLHDHAAAVYPWLVQAQRRGVRVVEVAEASAPETSAGAIVERYAARFTPRTRVLCLAHVRDCDGTVLPVSELCTLARGRGVFTLVDGALAAGQLDVRLAELGCDAYATGTDRWLNGPVDTGLLYVRRDAQARVWPAMPARADGWSPTDRFQVPLATAPPEFAASARLGNPLVRRGPAISAMPIAFEFQDAIGRTLIHGRIRQLADQLRRGLAQVPGLVVVTPSDPTLSAGIVTVRAAARDAGAIVEGLAREDRIVVGRVRHGAGFDAIRVSVHAGNDTVDVDRCVAAIQRRV